MAQLIDRATVHIQELSPTRHILSAGEIQIACIKRILLDSPDLNIWMVFYNSVETYSGTYSECIAHIKQKLNPQV